MYYNLGSSMGGCGVPSDKERFYVKDPTGSRSQFLGASGSRQGGYYYSPNNSREVDRYNPATKSNYSYFDPCKTYCK